MSDITEAPQDQSPQDRLDSWKEIAVYLRRSVRTVMRWEKEEGLPVHRHQHSKQGSVYAFREELDEWRALQDDHPETLTAGAAAALAKRGWWAVAVAVVLVVLLGLTLRARTARLGEARDEAVAADRVENRPWILVAQFDNRTGEEVLTGSLELALRRELVKSTVVRVVPIGRVGDVLRLMRKPVDTPIEGELAVEIALRDGGIHRVLTGRVERLGSTFVLSIDLVDPRSGELLSTFDDEAAELDELVPAISRIVAGLREALGEPAGVFSVDPGLTQVTTPSLRALRHFDQGESAMQLAKDHPSGAATAEKFFRQAVAEDPAFGFAWIMLAASLQMQWLEPQEFLEARERALESVAGLSDSEAYFVRGAYYCLPSYASAPSEEAYSDFAEAARNFHALVQMSPGHYWGNQFLQSSLGALGRFQERTEVRIKLAALLPHRVLNQQGAARDLQRRGDLDRAEIFFARAEQAAASLDYRSPGSRQVYRTFLEAQRLAASGNVAQLRAEILSIAEPTSPANDRDETRFFVAASRAGLGELAAAEALFSTIGNPQHRRAGLAQVAFARSSDFAPKIDVLEPITSEEEASVAGFVLAARSGTSSDYRQFLHESPDGRLDPYFSGSGAMRSWRHMQSEVLLAEGEQEQAREFLTEILEEAFPFCESFFLGSEALAEILDRNGDSAGAVSRVGAGELRRQGQRCPSGALVASPVATPNAVWPPRDGRPGAPAGRGARQATDLC